jgi:hypothetical protein
MKKILAIFLLLSVLASLVSCKLPRIQFVYDDEQKKDDEVNGEQNNDSGNPDEDIYIPTAGISLNEERITGHIGDTFSLTATVSPDNATDKSVVWHSENPSVAKVSQTGEVTLKGIGTTKIYAKSAEGYKAYCDITVEKNLEYFEKTITLGNYEDYLNVTIRKTSNAFVIHISPKFENYEYDVTFVYDITVTRIYEAGSRPTTKHDIVKCYIGTYTKPLVGHYNDVDYTLTSISGIVSGYIEK